jgi:dipeptidyl aminopeptidase/acylaminoacyl peptidase
MKKLTLLFILVLLVTSTFAQGYKQPPQNVLDVLNAPVTPNVSISPDNKYMLLSEGVRYPPISELAQPMLRLAGLRINPNTNGQHRQPYAVKLSLRTLDNENAKQIELPANAKVSSLRWSADGKHFAFTNTTENGIELWVADVESAKAKLLKKIQVNGILGGFQWMPDQKNLLVYMISNNRGAVPQRSIVPTEPNIQETSGRAGAVQTFQDLLKSPEDERLFEFLMTSQLAIVSLDGKIKQIGQPAIYDLASVSPDGQNILVSKIQRPFSYLYPFQRFPKEVEVINTDGKLNYKVASIPLQDNLPIEGVTTSPRSYNWIPTENATLIWTEALDGGNPKNKVDLRDKLMTIASPFSESPKQLLTTQFRSVGQIFGEKDGMMMYYDYNRDTQKRRVFMTDYRNPSAVPKLISDLNVNDRYNDIGTPVTKLLPNGKAVITQNGDDILLDGNGASTDGDRPFLDRMNLKTLSKLRVWQCDKESYESIVEVLNNSGNKIITRRESPSEPPNFFIKSLCPPNADCEAGIDKKLTNFTDPTPQLRGITKQLVKYKRADGVDLSFTLYLPPNYKAGTRLPTVVWAYPLEFTDASTAGQVSGSTKRFTSIGSYSHLFFLMQGYAVLDDTTMPVIGDPETVNETFVKQVVDSAKAAIDKATEMGVTDPERVGVGGHSYGAFMTANLLAHSDLFRAGIARSGAYNRTLTPFGFQSERRSFWEAKDMYMNVSPFAFADKIKEPILMIHGEADNNQGTFPIQSERMFAAIRGNGGTARLVMLPLEQHGYSARESIDHTLFEMIDWFDKYVKNAKPRGK